ncbi:phage integrase central domain-containing protein [Pseudoxanthomonas sp. 22568]|uniref:phage integrase central domain-containing protein n=1 Tax=Pseudoxanthomonas sp. 22568 TaxID=3453945 RepID=UPI003F85BF76
MPGRNTSPWRGRQVFPYIGGCLVTELTAPGFLRVGRRVEERGGGVCAHRVLQNCGQVQIADPRHNQPAYGGKQLETCRKWMRQGGGRINRLIKE